MSDLQDAVPKPTNPADMTQALTTFADAIEATNTQNQTVIDEKIASVNPKQIVNKAVSLAWATRQIIGE